MAQYTYMEAVSLQNVTTVDRTNQIYFQMEMEKRQLSGSIHIRDVYSKFDNQTTRQHEIESN